MRARAWTALPLAVTLAVVFATTAGCGQSVVRTSQATGDWDAVDLPLSPGARYATYDEARDAIWILTGPRDSSQALLTRYDIRREDARSYPIPGQTAGITLSAGLTVDGDGQVWAAWGKRLLLFEPAAERFDEWVIPAPEATYVESIDDGLDGLAVDIAAGQDGRVWVAQHSTRALQAFTPESGAWDTVATSALIALSRTQLNVRGDGSLVENGATLDNGVFTSAMATIDPVQRVATMLMNSALQYAMVDDTAVYVVEQTGEIRSFAPETASADKATGVSVEGVSPLVSLTASGGRSAWLWRGSYLAVEVVRVDAAAGFAVTFQFPLRRTSLAGGGSSATGGPPPDEPVAIDPGIQALVADKHGDIWVITDHGSASATEPQGYAQMYRLHPAS